MSESAFCETSSEATSASDEQESDHQYDPEDEGRTDSSSLSDDLANAESPSSASQSRPRSTSKPGRHQGRARLTAYRNLLNLVIADVNATHEDSSDFASSYIGVSLWTSAEKEKLFSALARHGRCELPLLADAIKTKSVTEIRVFLTLLDQGVVEANLSLKTHDGFSPADVPAAIEIGSECEHALDAAARALGKVVYEYDVEAEKRRHGDYWLIDHELAAQLDEQFDVSDELQEQDSSASSSDRDEEGRPLQDRSSSEVSDTIEMPAADLLRPSSFIQLATDVFMNGPSDHEANWRDHINDEGGPSILRTALEDFQNLAVSLTRRLVQATLFQTMSRLRANDTHHSTWRPVEAVNRVDVETAIDMLGIRANYHEYWVKLPRRAGIKVRSTSSKYKDGRDTKHDAVTLTYDEVEAELGLAHSFAPEINCQDASHADSQSWDTDEPDSDYYTDVTVSDRSESVLCPRPAVKANSGHSNDEESTELKRMPSNTNLKAEEVENDEGIWPEPSKPMATALGPRDQMKAEDRFLDAFDHSATLQEESQLWDMLRKAPSTQPNIVDMPEAPTLKRRVDEMIGTWRSRTQYQAAWEQFGGLVGQDEFEATELHARKNKLRRTKEHDGMSSSNAEGVQLTLPVRGIEHDVAEDRYYGDSDTDDGDDMQSSF